MSNGLPVPPPSEAPLPFSCPPLPFTSIFSPLTILMSKNGETSQAASSVEYRRRSSPVGTFRHCRGTNCVVFFVFHGHAINTAAENKLKPSSGKKSHENESYKRLMYKQFVQISGLCGPQFLIYLPKHFTHPFFVGFVWRRHISVHQYGRRKSTKTSGVHFFYKSSFFSLES